MKWEVVATDNASYSDRVFGLFKILGYNFSPRFRDLDDSGSGGPRCPALRRTVTAPRRTGHATA